MIDHYFRLFCVIILFTIIQTVSLCAMQRSSIRILQAKPSYLVSLYNKSLNVRWHATENSVKSHAHIRRLNRCTKMWWAIGGGLVTFTTQDLLRAMILSGKDAFNNTFILQEKEQS